MHLWLEIPNKAEIEKSVITLSETGLPIYVTELDVTVLPNPRGNTGADVSMNAAYQEKLNP